MAEQETAIGRMNREAEDRYTQSLVQQAEATGITELAATIWSRGWHAGWTEARGTGTDSTPNPFDPEDIRRHRVRAAALTKTQDGGR